MLWPPRSDPLSKQAGHTRTFVLLRLVAGLAFIAVVAACSASNSLDSAALEADIAEQLLPQYPGAIRSVACPSVEDPVVGQELLCVASLGAQVIDVDVTIGGTAEELTTTATVDARFVALNEVAALLGATFGDQVGLVTSVDCGQPVVVLAQDETVICTTTDPSGVVRDFDVGVDDDGQISIDLR